MLCLRSDSRCPQLRENVRVQHAIRNVFCSRSFVVQMLESCELSIFVSFKLPSQLSRFHSKTRLLIGKDLEVVDVAGFPCCCRHPCSTRRRSGDGLRLQAG